MSSFSLVVASFFEVDLWNLSNRALTLAKILFVSVLAALLPSLSFEGCWLSMTEFLGFVVTDGLTVREF